jgi:putative membrane protein
MSLHVQSSGEPAAPASPVRRRSGRRFALPVLSVVSALLVIGPVGAAQARSSAPGANAVPQAAATAPAGGGVTLQTEEPALTDMDRALLTQVRLAGLWEIPAGKMAMEKGKSPRVRQIGQMIASQHVRLDTQDKAAAKEVGVALPDRPTGPQTRWLHEMEGAQGTAFDSIFVMRLRNAHGKIFPVIAAVRSSTHNDVVRKIAQSANNFVLTHLTLLESTGLVQYDEVAKAEAPPTAAASASTGKSGSIAVPVVWMILATALIAGAVVTARMIRPSDPDGGSQGRRKAGGQDPVHTGLIPVQSAPQRQHV